MLNLRGISRSFADRTVVDNLSFKVNEGEFVALLGPSGCGKSTSLKMIAGLETPDQGEIELDGRNITHLSPGERKLAMVFQSYALFPHLNVKDNILFGLQARKVAKTLQTKRLASVIEMVGLGDQLEKKPAQLSGGQCQRVALARAIVAEAKLCLMDEPLSNLDAKLRDEMRAEIRALQQRLGMSVIYVTHDQVEAMSMADRVVLMNAGKIEQIDRPELLYSQPKTIFAATFIGSPAMNIIKSRGTCLGIRPEHINIGEQGRAARVISCDYHGADTIVSADLVQDAVVKIRCRGKALLRRDQTIFVSWSAEHEHRFTL